VIQVGADAKPPADHGFAKGGQLAMTLAVCALGYFVDIYDLILFSIVRTESLHGMGVTAEGMQAASELILNAQMVGMLLGGILFGVLADKRGRLSILMASILLYSIMNIMNAFVDSVPAYAVLRLFAGIGLAGELGVAITLVAEVMPKESRGFGTTLVATMGILGAVGAYTVHSLFNWQAAFIAGGILGLMLLVLRVRVHESGMFRRTEMATVARGNLLMLLQPNRLLIYAACVAIGVPVWYVIGILVTFSPEFTAQSGSTDTVVAGLSVMWAYVGLAAGDLASGLLSQLLRSRKSVVLIFLIMTSACIWWYLQSSGKSATLTYIQCGILGFATGYWAVFVTTAAEQFGTNLRATVATTVPNFVRGSLVLALLLLNLVKGAQGSMVGAAAVVGVVAMAIAVGGWLVLRETYGKDLDYVEV
jgi:predicted MFS family arabinose efflux permease